MHKNSIQNWFYNAWFDLGFILSPPFIVVLLVFLFSSFFQQTNMSDVFWLIVVVFVDVAHVYSTLFKTYFDKSKFEKNRNLYIVVPVLCYVIGVLLHSEGSHFYWRILAYLAVFHFIRQQYGFFRLYSRADKQAKWEYYLDNTSIYMATLYPVIYWHTHPETPFNWFVENDFIVFQSDVLSAFSGWMYTVVFAMYGVKELFKLIVIRKFNIPKNLVFVGTALSWYMSIVYFKSDIAFTTINVVSHGIPYVGLIFADGKLEKSSNPFMKLVFQSVVGIVLFIGVLLVFSYLEEGLWDSFVWNEHQVLFPIFHSFLPTVNDKHLLTLIVPLLSLPQTTHYVLDGFIWRKANS
jgi:hypothetical protein